MKFRLVLAIVALAFGLAFPASTLAQEQAQQGDLANSTSSPGVAIGVTAPGDRPIVVVPAAAPATIDTGSLAGQALLWVTTVFGGTIGTVITAWVWKLFRLAGIQATDALRARFQEIIVNGLNAGAAAAAKDLQGKGKVEVKNAIVAKAVVYAQEHGAETMKQLGIDPTSSKAVEAIKARIETAIADPAAATPAAVDPEPPVANQNLAPGQGPTIGGAA